MTGMPSIYRGSTPTQAPPFTNLTTGNMVAVGGGKGGVGKSLIASSIACGLALSGRKVILVDADLAGANIHLLFGIKFPEKTLGDYLKRKVPSFKDVLIHTSLPNLSLICGASDLLEIANPHFDQKRNLMEEISRLNTDAVVIDIGAGATLNNLDFFNMAGTGIIVTTPDPTAIQNAYSFLKMAVHRRVLSLFSDDSLAKNVLNNSFSDIDTFTNMKYIIDLLRQVDHSAAEKVSALLNESRYRLVVNLATPGGGEQVLKTLDSVSSQYLNIRLASFGSIGYHADVEKSIRKMEPLLTRNNGALSGIFMKIAGKLIEDWAKGQPPVRPITRSRERVPAARKEERGSPAPLCLYDETLCQGVKLHVQTQDLGVKKARIATIVFREGAILFTRETSYRGVLDGKNTGYGVDERVKAQHRRMLADISIYLDSNLRKASRFAVNQPVDYDHEGDGGRSALRNISENGAFVVSLAPLPDGSEITLRFYLPGEERQFVVTGRVAYSISLDPYQLVVANARLRNRKVSAVPGMGIRFTAVTDTDRDAIRDFLKKT